MSAILLAGRFLFPFDDGKYLDDPNWRYASRWLVFWGLVIGAVYAVVFRGAWRWFGEYEKLRLVPVAVILSIDLGWCGYRLISSVAIVLASRNQQNDIMKLDVSVLVFVLIIVIFKLALLLSLPMGGRVWPADWRNHFWPLYPYVTYRPLILMPLWGRWAMMLAIIIGRIAPADTSRLRRMAEGTNLVFIMFYWLLCSGLTVVYCSADVKHIPLGIVIALGIMVVTYLTSFFLARRFAGQTELTLGVTGLVGELAFLVFYQPFARYIYWY
ncbi:MAG: adenosylcobinamide-GDP ribazoletransferase [Planctomycetota bacterium]|nr:MAG: adenosylcobinamide-GDP ribazoletransferase [Planctomycetota bacterium]